MKLIAFILSTFILAMAVMPCTDNVSTITNNNVEVAHFDMETHEHQHNHSDDCTPFCTCQCCGASVIVTSRVQYDDLKEAPTFSFSFNYTFNYAFDYSKGIWHPPSIS